MVFMESTVAGISKFLKFGLYSALSVNWADILVVVKKLSMQKVRVARLIEFNFKRGVRQNNLLATKIRLFLKYLTKTKDPFIILDKGIFCTRS